MAVYHVLWSTRGSRLEIECISGLGQADQIHSLQVPDGYRDLKLYVRFHDSWGLGIIGEIQFHDRKLHDIKLQASICIRPLLL